MADSPRVVNSKTNQRLAKAQALADKARAEQIEQRRKLWQALTAHIQSDGDWVTSLPGTKHLRFRGAPRFGIASEAHRTWLCGAPFRHHNMDHRRRRGSWLHGGRYNRVYAARAMIDGNRLGLSEGCDQKEGLGRLAE